jgi:hypothetical protein
VTFVFFGGSTTVKNLSADSLRCGNGHEPYEHGCHEPHEHGRNEPMNMAGYGGCGSLPDDVAASGC